MINDMNIYLRFTEEERDTRNFLGKKIWDCTVQYNRDRKSIEELKNTVQFIITQIRFCKMQISVSPAKINVKDELWVPATAFQAPRDFTNTSKAYAYLLYYRDRLKHVEKSIKKLRREMAEHGREMDRAVKALSAFDDEISSKYFPAWMPCKFTLKKGETILGERDCNPYVITQGKQFFRCKKWEWYNHYTLKDVKSFEDVEVE